jgi:hypothetical protein
MKASINIIVALMLGFTNGLRSHYINLSRRDILFSAAGASTGVSLIPSKSNAAGSNGLSLSTAASGLKWADAKVGSGLPLGLGASASIDYSMASTVGRLPQIYTTKDKGTPYRWTLGDGSTIAGIEQAILGSEDIPAMLPGGIRRVIVPADLGYQSTLETSNPKCQEDGRTIGPVPPKKSDGGYQRWYQFYCNPRIPYVSAKCKTYFFFQVSLSNHKFSILSSIRRSNLILFWTSSFMERERLKVKNLINIIV